MLAALLALLMAAPADQIVCAPSKTAVQLCGVKRDHTVKYYECTWAGKAQFCNEVSK